MAGDCLRSLLVDENDVFRAGLRDYLKAEGIAILGEADDPAVVREIS